MDASAYLGGGAGSFLNYKKLQELGGRATATIVNVQPYADNAGKSKLVLVFQSGVSLALNKTNLKIVCDRLGNDTDRWTGKQVTLVADPTVKNKGQTVGGIVVQIS